MNHPDRTARLRAHCEAAANEDWTRLTHDLGVRGPLYGRLRRDFPAEMAPFFKGLGFHSVGLFAREGIATFAAREPEALQRVDAGAHQRALECLGERATDPTALGASCHLLHIAGMAMEDA